MVIFILKYQCSVNYRKGWIFTKITHMYTFINFTKPCEWMESDLNETRFMQTWSKSSIIISLKFKHTWHCIGALRNICNMICKHTSDFRLRGNFENLRGNSGLIFNWIASLLCSYPVKEEWHFFISNTNILPLNLKHQGAAWFSPTLFYIPRSQNISNKTSFSDSDFFSKHSKHYPKCSNLLQYDA